MKLDALLSKAARLAKKRDYQSALKILKDEEDRYNGSFKYYYLYAIISLHSGSFVEALENFEMAMRKKMKDPNTLLGLAALYLKRLNTVKAVDYYLDVQEGDPKNKIAKKALAIIRGHSTSEALSDWMTPEKLAKLFPPIPGSAVSSAVVLSCVLIFAAAVVIVSGILVVARVIPSPVKPRETRVTAEFVLSRQERSEPVEVGGYYGYILTRDQATSLYDRALSLFAEFRDEAAKINLNRLLESNASEGLKNKARLLLRYTEVPGFDTFKQGDNFSYSEVRKEPILYRDAHIIWRGMAVNIEVTDEGTRFDLLVGYDTRTALEGIVPVFFDRPVSLTGERPLEVLGKIAVSPSLEIMLEGVAIHQSGRLENN